jgi:hypothetical protein
MAIVKYQLLINWKQTAGWSEIYYKQVSDSDVSPNALLATGRDLAQRRALVLTPVARIVGLRATNTNIPRVTTLQRLAIQGQNTQILSSSGPDVVNVAILATMSSSLGGKRQFLMRGLLDDDVVDGDITLAQSGVGIFTTWFNFLGSGSFKIRDLQPGTPRPIGAVAGGTGQVDCSAAADFAVDDLVTLKTRTSGGGKKVNWTGRVLSTGPTVVQLRNYKWGDAFGGTLTKQTLAFGDIARFTVPFPQRARTRQTGRPFDLLRGRAASR